MAVSDRVAGAARRAGWPASAAPRRPTRHELAALMVGQEVAPPPVPPVVAGPVAARHGAGRRPFAGRNATPLDDITLSLHGGEITGLAGVSGNGQAALAGLLSRHRGAARRAAVRPGRAGRPGLVAARRARRRHRAHPRGPPRRRHDRRHERHRERHRRALPHGPLQPGAACSTGRRRAHSPRRSSPTTTSSVRRPRRRIRLLSGGNMQKLILGRALDPEPVIILANQPTRGLDVGAVGLCPRRLLEARDARRRGPADLGGPRGDPGAVRPHRRDLEGPAVDPLGARRAQRARLGQLGRHDGAGRAA